MKETQARIKLGPDDQITTYEQADAVLAEINTLLVQRDNVANKALEECAATTNTATLNIENLIQAIEIRTMRLKAFFDAYVAPTLQGKKKSIERDTGEMGYAKDKDKYDLPEDAALVAKLNELPQLFGVPDETVKGCYTIVTVTADQISINRKAVLALEDRENGAEILRYLGIQFIPGEEHFFAQRDAGKALKKFASLSKALKG